jgi:hypothetical protein
MWPNGPTVHTGTENSALAANATEDREREEAPKVRPRRAIKLFGRSFTMPESRGRRIAMGSGLVIGGCLGFLPILGFWMIPLGLVVLSYEFPTIRRWRRNAVIWWGRRKMARKRKRA